MHLKANSQHFSLACTAHLVYHSIINVKKHSPAPRKDRIKHRYGCIVKYTICTDF